jgi:phosphotransferase system enzyme I (PtsI)
MDESLEKISRPTSWEINGIAASPGIAIGQAYVIRNVERAATGLLLESESDVLKAISTFDQAVQTAVDEVEVIKNTVGLNQEEIEILETHIEFLTDPQIRANVLEKITSNRQTVIDAVIDVINQAVQLFQKMDDAYMRARAADVQDIGNRILNILHHSTGQFQHFSPHTILVADDISPSQTITLNLSQVVAFATQVGGKTSHTAILAKSKHIPAVLGCGQALSQIQDQDVIIVDGTKGIVIINPTENRLAAYQSQKEEDDQKWQWLRSLTDAPAQTSDGVAIQLLANISSASDMEEALTYAVAGVGLFRTELLFMNRDTFPSEEEQFEFYKRVALQSKGKPVTVRTIDIGGDKPLDYFPFPKEENPFLGYRGIRICLDRQDIFVTQLRAILRASVFGNFKLMFPMISNLQELRLAKQILVETQNELAINQVAFNPDIPVGIMIEVPSAAITADLLAKEVDFFSIGTNDLCQYTLAVDRTNEKIKNLYDPYNPAVLRLISNIIEQAQKQRIQVSMCGELASDPQATLLLIGMGLIEFSMSASAIPVIKNELINHSHAEAKGVWEQVKTMASSTRIIDYLQSKNDR